MRFAWLLVAIVLLVPLTAGAHPGSLDRNSCHFCRFNCDRHGLKVGDYVCHPEGNRSENLTYTEMQLLERRLQKLQEPTLRETARKLRKREARRNKILYAKNPACWPTFDFVNDAQMAPMLPRYSRLGRFGELLTAFACKNTLGTVPMVDVEENISGSLTLTLRKKPTDVALLALKRIGFSCTQDTEEEMTEKQRIALETTCIEWTLDDPLIPATILKPILAVASQVGKADCPSCGDPSEQPIPDETKLQLDELFEEPVPTEPTPPEEPVSDQGQPQAPADEAPVTGQ